MSVLKVVLLGVIQGLTEFIPVSSSGHLVLASRLLNIKELPMYLNLLMHTGTLLAVCFYLRRDIYKIIKERNARIILLLTAATTPAVIAGVALKKFFEQFFSEPSMVLVFLAGTGAILIIGELAGKKTKGLDALNIKNALFIGVMQAVAILPGISRSGSTMSAGMMSGMKREEAAKFSFLLSIPIILGTTVFEMKDAPFGNGIREVVMIGGAGLVASAVSGVFAITFLMRIIRTRNFYPFAVYCIALSAIGLLGLSLR